MEDNKGVTVIIPAYNCEKTIGQVLDAITGQRYPNYEVIVIDDGSTDGTEGIVKKYPDVKYIRNDKNLGLANTLNKGIKLSENELIITLHADCVPQTKDWIAHMVEMVTADEMIGAVSSKYTLPKEIWEKLDFIPKVLFSSWIDQPLGFLNNKCDIYKKSALSQVGFFGSRYFRVGGE
ncbi:MAG: glycosyltransferase family 2 protein, partial [Candidatus Dadabacteria bacterium]